MSEDSNDTDRAGVNLAGLRITQQVGIFREQSTSDYGVDAHVEFKHDGVPTGRLVGLQIKSGPSHAKLTKDGNAWVFYPERKHITYWLGHSLPMYLLLVDVDEETLHWQELFAQTLQTGPKGGLFVTVPKANTLETAQGPWERAADKFAETANLHYDDNLTRLSPSTARAVRSVAEVDPMAAALLAARFASGRSAPEFVVRSLISAVPSWLSAVPWSDGIAAVAEYARSHELTLLAVDALLMTVDGDDAKALKRLRVAGLLLLFVDRARSIQVLNDALGRAGGSQDLHVAIGLAIAAQPENDASPVPMTLDLERRVEEAVDDEFVLAFKAVRAQRMQDLDGAVALFEKALSVVPDAAEMMLGLAESLARRARSSAAKPHDFESSISWAEQALDQLHKWSGPTQAALTTLLQAQMSAGQVAQALNRCLPAPGGRAKAEESLRPAVQATAAIAAYALERLDFAKELIERMAPGIDRDLAQARMRLDDDDSQRRSWRSIIRRLDESRPEALVTAVMRLADLGVDESPRLDDLVARHVVPQSMQELARLTALAFENLDAALPELRILAETEEIAAVNLSQMLLAAHRWKDAIAACQAGHVRFGATEFLLFEADALQNSDGDPSRIETVLQEVLASPSVDPLNRQLAHRRLADVLSRRAFQVQEPKRTALWCRVEHHLYECVHTADVQERARDIWLLVDAQWRLGKAGEAVTTLSDFDPPIARNEEARLWFTVVRARRDLSTREFSRMLDLADQFEDDPELSTGLLAFVTTRTRDASDEPASPVDSRAILTEDLRANAFAMLQSHIDRFGDATPIKVLTGESPEDLVALMTDTLRRDNQPIIDAVEMTRQARLPFGFLALLAHRPYSSTLAGRPLGYTLAAAAIEDDDVADESDASSAMGNDIVVDTSALMVASDLEEYDRFRGHFRSLSMPMTSQTDIDQGRSDLDGRSSSAGVVTYDSESDSIVASELDVEELLETVRRFERIEQAAKSLLMVPAVPLDSLGEIVMPGADAWLGPIALAKATGIALWSDDVAQRRLARVLGVKTFGTTTLQQLRITKRIEAPSLTDDHMAQLIEERRREVVSLIAHRIVDAATDASTVIQAAEAEEWTESVALVTIGRPGWWHLAANPFEDLRSILEAAKAGAKANLDTWRYHAMWGVVRVADGEPSRQAMLLAAVAMLPTDLNRNADQAVRHLAAADQIATTRGAHPPADYLAEAEVTLVTAGVLPAGSDYLTTIRKQLASSQPERSTETTAPETPPDNA